MPSGPRKHYKGLRRASPVLASVRRGRFDPGQPIAKIDMRPLVFVAAFIVLVIAITRFGPFPVSQGLDLPTVEAKPLYQLDERFVVTVVSTNIERTNWDTLDSVSEARFTPPLEHGDCRAFLSDGTEITGDQLYEYGFGLLDDMVGMAAAGVEFAYYGPPKKIPKFYIQADQNTRWRCVAGAISNLERAGFPTIGLLTSPTT